MAVTVPENESSIRVHQRLGFHVSALMQDYNGVERAMVTFTRSLKP